MAGSDLVEEYVDSLVVRSGHGLRQKARGSVDRCDGEVGSCTAVAHDDLQPGRPVEVFARKDEAQ
jgi:hypothetical protein